MANKLCLLPGLVPLAPATSVTDTLWGLVDEIHSRSKVLRNLIAIFGSPHGFIVRS